MLYQTYPVYPVLLYGRVISVTPAEWNIWNEIYGAGVAGMKKNVKNIKKYQFQQKVQKNINSETADGTFVQSSYARVTEEYVRST